MFRAWCAAEGTEVLLTTRHITAIRLTDDASEIAFTCWCGHRGHVHDRRPGRRPLTAVAGPAATAA